MNWIEREILTGIQQLLCLGLEGQPAAELIDGTASAWISAITLDRVFDEELDAERFRTAFRTLSGTCDRWPSPKRFLEAMPRRAESLAIGREAKCSPEVAKANLARIGEMLNSTGIYATPEPRDEAA